MAKRYVRTPAPKAVRRHKCPICKSQTVEGYKPFCSKRCADVDLGKWFSKFLCHSWRSEHDDEAAGAEKPASGDPDDGP